MPNKEDTNKPGDAITDTIDATFTNTEIIHAPIAGHGRPSVSNWCVTIFNTGANSITTFNWKSCAYIGGIAVDDDAINTAIPTIAAGAKKQIRMNGEAIAEIRIAMTSTVGTNYSIEVSAN